jgi:antitoxin VapB
MSHHPTPAGAPAPSPTRTARLFRNGVNQAVRLPRDFEIDADEVIIRRDGDNLILTPKPRSWDDYFSHARRLDPDFPNPCETCPPEEREPL